MIKIDDSDTAISVETVHPGIPPETKSTINLHRSNRLLYMRFLRLL
jgi:hypothetical protein